MSCWEMLKLQLKKKKASVAEGQEDCLPPEYQFSIIMSKL